ncbi:MAG: PspC domain-containing protein [Chloroflexi bacterium]|nr:MAG: PspC domain-containing protein [Chloroflexota bacterium]
MTIQQKLTRSRSDRLISGVCGGLARYFSLDTVLVRGIFVVVGLMSMGMAAILYLAAIFLIPEESEIGAANQNHPGWRFDPWTGERVNAPKSAEPQNEIVAVPATTTATHPSNENADMR